MRWKAEVAVFFRDIDLLGTISRKTRGNFGSLSSSSSDSATSPQRIAFLAIVDAKEESIRDGQNNNTFLLIHIDIQNELPTNC